MRTRAKSLKDRAKATRLASEQKAAEHAELRETVRELAARLRKLGAPPETVVVAVKGISDEAADATAPPLRRADRLALTQDLVRWAIQGYDAA